MKGGGLLRQIRTKVKLKTEEGNKGVFLGRGACPKNVGIVCDSYLKVVSVLHKDSSKKRDIFFSLSLMQVLDISDMFMYVHEA